MSATGDRPLRLTVPAFRFLLLVPVLACLLAAAPVAMAGQDQVIHEAAFDAGALRWEADHQGAPYPVLDGTRVLAEPGLPQLPAKELTFLVPLEFEVADENMDVLFSKVFAPSGCVVLERYSGFVDIRHDPRSVVGDVQLARQI